MADIRIIAGQLKNRKINVINHPELRPTGNRTRETLFNWLTPYIDKANCLDAFAGSGALGIEALSRGAQHVTFIESNSKVYRQLQRNLTSIAKESLSQETALFNQSAINWLQRACISTPFDIIFLDPPFTQPDLMQQALHWIIQKQALNPTSGLIYAETALCKTTQQMSNCAQPSGSEPNESHWQVHKEKRRSAVHARLLMLK